MHTKSTTLHIRLWASSVVDPVTGCWRWQGRGPNGKPPHYRRTEVDGHSVTVHRLAYTLFFGPIPEGYEVDHLCFTRDCWRPGHLEAVVPIVNRLRRPEGANEHHCQRGHARIPENIHRRPNGTGYCIPCAKANRLRERTPAFYARQRAQENARYHALSPEAKARIIQRHGEYRRARQARADFPDRPKAPAQGR